MSEDPRQRRTRESLGGALARLLATEPLDGISVAELCREAGVHRTTFYAHADNVRDFALAEFSRTIDNLSAVTVAPGEGPPEIVATRYFVALRHVLEHVVEDREAYRTLFGSSARGVFRSALEAPLRARARLAIEVWTRAGIPGVPREDSGIAEAAAHIAAGLAGAIEVWALSDEADAAAAAVRFAGLMPRWWPEPAVADR